jgi:hypothetical protein
LVCYRAIQLVHLLRKQQEQKEEYLLNFDGLQDQFFRARMQQNIQQPMHQQRGPKQAFIIMIVGLLLLTITAFYLYDSSPFVGLWIEDDYPSDTPLVITREVFTTSNVQNKSSENDEGTPPDPAELDDDPFYNKIKPPPLTYDESNPKVFTFRKNAGIHLITTFFKGSYHKERVNELIESLRRNIKNPYIEAVHVLYERDNPRADLQKTNVRDLLDTKLVTMKVPQQPTYFRLFGYANAALERGSIAIVANSDIYFDKTLVKLKFGAPKNDTNWRSAMALSRSHSADCGKEDDWNGIFDLCSTYIGSHDAFIFAPPVPDFVLKNSRHTQNHFGAENIIVFGFIWARGFRGHLSNPCKRIRAIHLHCSAERHYEIGASISSGRHGKIRPGVEPEHETTWNFIH